MNEEQLIATLQACYFGDRGAFNKMLKEYKQIQQENKELKEMHYLIQGGRGNGKTYLTKLQQENHQLKDKIEKAFKYIDYYVRIDDEHYEILKEILKGEENK